uniref:Uncharacterized protein n=1 Tax=Romanomermis culicivorax TaxID=13658 RepID=A0A915K083_ROMCU
MNIAASIRTLNELNMSSKLIEKVELQLLFASLWRNLFLYHGMRSNAPFVVGIRDNDNHLAAVKCSKKHNQSIGCFYKGPGGLTCQGLTKDDCQRTHKRDVQDNKTKVCTSGGASFDSLCETFSTVNPLSSPAVAVVRNNKPCPQRKYKGALRCQEQHLFDTVITTNMIKNYTMRIKIFSGFSVLLKNRSPGPKIFSDSPNPARNP